MNIAVAALTIESYHSNTPFINFDTYALAISIIVLSAVFYPLVLAQKFGPYITSHKYPHCGLLIFMYFDFIGSVYAYVFNTIVIILYTWHIKIDLYVFIAACILLSLACVSLLIHTVLICAEKSD